MSDLRSGYWAWTVLPCIGLSAVFPAEVSYFDKDGTSVLRAEGKIIDETPSEVIIETKDGEELRVAPYSIESVEYDGEPADLLNARNLQQQGRHQEAIEAFEKLAELVDREESPYLAKSIEFAILKSRWERARVNPSLRADLLTWYADHEESLKKSRYLVPTAEMIGQLQLDSGEWDQAEKTLGVLGTINWPGNRAKDFVYQGRLAIGRGDQAEAMRRFDDALRESGDRPETRSARQLALLSKAQLLFEQGTLEESATMYRSLIDADAEDDEPAVLAAAHNGLGDALHAAGQTKQAVLDGYLWVHVMYADDPAEHARSLYHLAQLFPEIGYPSYAEQMSQILRESFGESEWAQKLPAPVAR